MNPKFEIYYSLWAFSLKPPACCGKSGKTMAWKMLRRTANLGVNTQFFHHYQQHLSCITHSQYLSLFYFIKKEFFHCCWSLRVTKQFRYMTTMTNKVFYFKKNIDFKWKKYTNTGLHFWHFPTNYSFRATKWWSGLLFTLGIKIRTG